MAENKDQDVFVKELDNLRSQVPGLPNHPFRAAEAYWSGVRTNSALREAVSRDVGGLSATVGPKITDSDINGMSPEVMKIIANNEAMRNAMDASRGLSRSGMSKTGTVRAQEQSQRWFSGFTPKTSMIGGGANGPMGGDVYNAIPRFYDPLEYWDISGLPWNIADEGHRHKLHKWLRLYYATHYLVPVLVDIFTRFPLVGMSIESPDPALTAIYEDLFLGQLNYEDFLVGLGREFWLVGEAFPLGSFDEDLGVWEHEELINPEDVVIDNFPLLDSRQLKIVPPDYLRRIAQTRSPAREWYMLQQNYEDLIPYLLKGEHIPISPVMLTQVANKLNNWDDHGTPILLRGLRTLLHEEKLLASQDAIAERLYSPFILAKLGIMDMGDGLPPWIPTPQELQSVRDDIDITMAADFRVLVHHFGLEMTSVFGREQMPRLGDDFDRIERRLMEVFGVNPSLLSAGTNSQPYASSALQAEFMNQMLRTFQKILKDHFTFRASVVAEAQGHYAYEKKGQSRVPVYEDIVSYNEDGDKIITRKHKLLVPELQMSTLDLRDEATERQFLLGLRAAGLPIPDDKLMIGVSWKDNDYVDQYNRDIIKKTISQQRAKMDTYLALIIQGLPVPMDLKYEVESVLQGGTGPEAPPGGPPGAGGPGGPGAGGGSMPPGGAAGPSGPGSEFGAQMPSPPPGLGPGSDMQPPGGGPPPMAPGGAAGGPGAAPQISNERRPGLTYNTHVAGYTENNLLGSWINYAEKEILISVQSKKDAKVLAEKAAADHPGFSVSIKENCDAPEGSAWAMVDLSGGILAPWPESVRKRAQEIKESFDKYGWFYESEPEEKTAATIQEIEEDPEDPASWVIKANQKIGSENGQPIIIENSKQRKVLADVGPHKKYSIIDPLYDGEYDKLKDEELNNGNQESAG